VQTPFFTVGITLPLRCINDSALGRQCQPDNVVFGAFNRWGTLSLLTLSEDAGRLVHTASTYTKSATDAFKVHVIAPLTHLLTPEEPKKADTKKAKKEL
jgi:hypothetical protein